jgi:hypothetical protein
MRFHTEPIGYTRTVLSDLQGSWGNLREAVLKLHPFPESDRLLFHIDEAMSWESVRNLNRMRKAFLLVRNLASRIDDEDLALWTDHVQENLDEVAAAIAEGKRL